MRFAHTAFETSLWKGFVHLRSHPARVRGLKRKLWITQRIGQAGAAVAVAPCAVRGLKLFGFAHNVFAFFVVPCAGERILILRKQCFKSEPYFLNYFI